MPLSAGAGSEAGGVGKGHTGSGVAPVPFWGSARATAVALMFLANVICYADRANISVTILEMSKEQGWSKESQGVVLSGFFYGYICTQVLGGKLSQAYGGKPVLCCAVLVWSFFTFVTPAATRTSFNALFVTRVGMGLGEGMALPAIHDLTSAWVPTTERTRSVAFVGSGQLVGTVMALSSGPFVEASWPAVFHFYGLVGFLWVAFGARYLHSSPAHQPGVRPAERRFIEAHRSKPGSRDKLLPSTPGGGSGNGGTQPLPSLAGLMVSPPFVAIYVAHACFNYGYYMLLSWMPKFFADKGTSTSGAGLSSMLPFVCMFVADNAWSSWIDGRIAAGMPIQRARKLSTAICLLGPAAGLAVLGLFPTMSLQSSVFVMTLAMTMASTSHSGFWANLIDVCPQQSGYLLGVSNTLASVQGVACNLVTGFLLQETGSWGAAFSVAIGFYVVGSAVYACLAKGTAQYH